MDFYKRRERAMAVVRSLIRKGEDDDAIALVVQSETGMGKTFTTKYLEDLLAQGRDPRYKKVENELGEVEPQVATETMEER